MDRRSFIKKSAVGAGTRERLRKVYPFDLELHSREVMFM